MTKSSASRSLRPARADTNQPAAAAPVALHDDSGRGRLLRAAAHLFLTRGYAATTVREIGRDAGILSGSIFHHFESKEAILEAVMLDVSTLNTERMQRAADGGKTPLARVQRLLRCELESIHGDTSEAMTLLSTEWRSLSAPAQARVLVVRERYEAVWLSTLSAAREQLALPDMTILRRLILGMTAGSATWFRAAPRTPVRARLSIDALAEHVLTLIAAPNAADTSTRARRAPPRPTRANKQKVRHG